MPKSETLLQVIIFGLTAATVLLLAARIYPSGLFKEENKADSKQAYFATRQASAQPITPPQSISIPTIGLQLSIAPATIVDNQWTLYDNKVSWLATSKIPGSGNVILFAHNRPVLFGNLKKLQLGQEIIVTQEDKQIIYEVVEKRKVTPQDVDAVIGDRDQLTLYTCDGSFDQKRLIVVALPKAKSRV